MHTMTATRPAVFVPAGEDRNHASRPIWGQIPLDTKVSSTDTGGSLFVFQHADMNKLGPPRHVHFSQDEWFFVVKGEFAMEVGEERFHLRPGDSLLAPRNVPHAWVCISDAPGTLMTAVTPAGTFEAFLRETTMQKTPPSHEEIARVFAAHDMKVLGPPLHVG